MRKFYLLVLLISAICVAHAQSPQKKAVFKSDNGVRSGHISFHIPLNSIQDACDTLNYPIPDSWGGIIYPAVTEDNQPAGFVSGTNAFGDMQDAQFFDASGMGDTYLTQAWLGFGIASMANPAKVVPVNVYDGTSGSPGALLGTANLTMGQIVSAVNDTDYTQVVFNPAITLPSSGQFFISFSLVNLNYFGTPPDSLAIVTSYAGAATGAWTLTSDSTWLSYSDPSNWDADMALYIHAFVSSNATCSALPVHLLSFTAQGKQSNVLLNWQVAQETGMKQYVVQRATDNLNFVDAGTVAAINTPANHSYTFTDANALTAGNKLFYRLKQINNDGRIYYSNIISITLPGTQPLTVTVVNPFKTAVQVQINAPYAQKMQAVIYDLAGRKITEAGGQTLTAGQNSISIPVGSSLAKGIYILNLYVGQTVYKYKLVNQ